MTRRPSLFQVCCAVLACCVAITWSVATSAALSAATVETGDVLLRRDGWGTFQPGAWQEVRVVTESLDPRGVVTSTTTTNKVTTLLAIRPSSVRLETEVVTEMAGKRFESLVQRIDQGCHGEAQGDRTTVRELGAANTTLEGKSIACQVREYEIVDGDQKKKVRVYYSADVAPYVLHRECVATSLDGRKRRLHSQYDVLAVNMPQQILKQMVPVAVTRTVQSTDTTSSTTVSALSNDVPGGIVAASTKELDAQGRLVRRSTLELVDWGLQSDLDPREKQGRRARRSSRRGNN